MLPIHYPKELLTALDLLAVELWGPPGAPRGDDAGRIQTYVCAVVRNALGLPRLGRRRRGGRRALPPHLRLDPGAGHAGPRLRRLEEACVHLPPPQGRRPPQRAALRARPSCARWPASSRPWPARTLEPRPARRRAPAPRARSTPAARPSSTRAPRSPLDDRGALRAAPARRVALARGAPRRAPRRRARLGDGPAAGGRPGPRVRLRARADGPARDAERRRRLRGRRRLRRGGAPRGARAPTGPSADPWAALLDRYLAAPPCPTRSADQGARMRHLDGAARAQRCTRRDHPRAEVLRARALRRPGHPAHLRGPRRAGARTSRGSWRRQLSGQVVTRIEAFVEMLSAGRAA